MVELKVDGAMALAAAATVTNQHCGSHAVGDMAAGGAIFVSGPLQRRDLEEFSQFGEVQNLGGAD